MVSVILRGSRGCAPWVCLPSILGNELPGIGLLKGHVGTCIPVVITSPLAVPTAGV